MPRRPVVDRPPHPGPDARERIELLDGGVGAVRDERARVPERAEGIGAVGPIGPEPLGEVAIRGAWRELHRARRRRYPRSGRRPSGARHCACSIRWRSPSGAQTSRVASNASSASRFARSPIACTPTGQPGARRSRMTSASSSPLVIRTPRAVEHPRGLRAERAVHEHLQVADPQEVVADARAEPERLELAEPLVRAPTARHAASAASRSWMRWKIAARRASRPCRGSRSTPRLRRCGAPRASPRPTRPRSASRSARAEPPGRLLAQDAGRLARLVALDDAARRPRDRRLRSASAAELSQSEW